MVTFETSSADETDVSSRSRSTARPTPTMKAQHEGQPQVADRLGRHGPRRHLGVVHDGCLDQGSAFPFGVSMSSTRSLSALA